jgi:hypothetical protein
VYVTYNAVSISFVYPHFLEDMAQAEFARRSADVSQAEARQVLESIRARTNIGTIVAGNFRTLLTWGTALSALTAVAFRKR